MAFDFGGRANTERIIADVGQTGSAFSSADLWLT